MHKRHKKEAPTPTPTPTPTDTRQAATISNVWGHDLFRHFNVVGPDNVDFEWLVGEYLGTKGWSAKFNVVLASLLQGESSTQRPWYANHIGTNGHMLSWSRQGFFNNRVMMRPCGCTYINLSGPLVSQCYSCRHGFNPQSSSLYSS